MEQQKFLGHWIALFCTFAFVSPFFCESYDYRNALYKSLLYFEAQRSGPLPPNQRVRWRYHSGLRDGLEQRVDLVGGYYDAGDNVKFGLPMAFTITMLSWSVMQYQQEIANAGEYEHALEAIKWGTDYFIKAHSRPHVLWAQVGDGYSDHRCWQRPEDMTTSRRGYKVDEKNPGSDVAGETAAGMAAASIVFKETNPHYSHLLLFHAEQLFEFADNYRGEYDISIPSAKHFYRSSSGYKDELLWAALWLYKATGNREYLHYAMENANSFGGSTWEVAEFSWDIKYAGVQALAAMLQEDEIHEDYRQIMQHYRSKADHYMCACLNKTASANVQRTPGGLLYTREWNNLQYVTAATFLLMAYSENLHAAGKKLSCSAGDVSPAEMFNFAKSQVDYILGTNPKGVSYLVGYGMDFPKRVHHRGASIKAKRNGREFVGCTKGYEKWYDTDKPNPHVLVGAVVGGPDENDEFNDHRDNFRQTEACTYNTAPLVGVFARLNDLYIGQG